MIFVEYTPPGKKKKKRVTVLMPVLTLIFALFVFLFPKTLEASKAESAIQCAALYLISSSTAHENKELAETFQNLQKMYKNRFYV